MQPWNFVAEHLSCQYRPYSITARKISISDIPKVLRCFGYNYNKLPLSIEDAVGDLIKTIESKGGHVHLHIHEHTHKSLSKIGHDLHAHQHISGLKEKKNETKK